MKLRFLGALALMVAMLPGSANAAYTLQFGQGGVAGITDFQASVGSTLEIELYITQSGSSTLLTDLGLNGYVDLVFNIDGAGGAIHDSIGGESTYVFAPDFSEGQSRVLSNGDQTLTLTGGRNSGGTTPPPGSDSVLLGTALVQVNALGVYNLEMIGDPSFGFITPNLDQLNPGNGFATITAVPEPGSFAVLGLCAGSGALVRWRRRRQAAAAAAV